MASSADNLKPAVAVRPAPVTARLVPTAGLLSAAGLPPGTRSTLAAKSTLAARPSPAAGLAFAMRPIPAARPALAANLSAQAKAVNTPMNPTGNVGNHYYSAVRVRIRCEEAARSLGLGSPKSMTELLKLPSLRDVTRNVTKLGEPRKISLTRRPRSEAILMQLTGQEAPGPCERCKSGASQFGECIVSDDVEMGACAGYFVGEYMFISSCSKAESARVLGGR